MNDKLNKLEERLKDLRRKAENIHDELTQIRLGDMTKPRYPHVYWVDMWLCRDDRGATWISVHEPADTEVIARQTIRVDFGRAML